METIDILSRFGLGKNEAKIYDALIKSGSAIISQIVKQTGLHRPTVYKALIPLQEKALVTVVSKGKRRLYSAEPPERLSGILESFKNDFDAMLPELQRTYSVSKKHPIVKFLEGREGIRAAIGDIVNSQKRGSTYYRYTSKRAADAGDKYVPRSYYTRRDAKQLQRVLITDALTDRQKRASLNSSYKILPAGINISEDNIEEFIYANKILFIDWDSETAVIIENSIVSDFQRRLFKVLYNLL